MSKRMNEKEKEKEKKNKPVPMPPSLPFLPLLLWRTKRKKEEDRRRKTKKQSEKMKQKNEKEKSAKCIQNLFSTCQNSKWTQRFICFFLRRLKRMEWRISFCSSHLELPLHILRSSWFTRRRQITRWRKRKPNREKYEKIQKGLETQQNQELLCNKLIKFG